MKTALIAMVLTTSACVTVVHVPCDIDPCGATARGIRPRTAEQIQIVRKGEALPAGAKMLGIVEVPPGCTDASIAVFRGKAALLGFDGVGNVEEKAGADGPVCTGQAFVVAGAKP